MLQAVFRLSGSVRECGAVCALWWLILRCEVSALAAASAADTQSDSSVRKLSTAEIKLGYRNQTHDVNKAELN